jgi:hypothetical protein
MGGCVIVIKLYEVLIIRHADEPDAVAQHASPCHVLCLKKFESVLGVPPAVGDKRDAYLLFSMI